MAWVLAGGLVAAYVGSLASDAWTNITKPIYDYIDAKRKESEDRAAEELRQSRIAHRKELLQKNNKIRSEYGIAEKNITKLINDTGNYCRVTFVNHEQASNITEAKRCSEPAQTFILAPNESMKLIELEFEEYFILLSIRDDIAVLTTDKFGREIISIQSLYHTDTVADVECAWFKV
jgi:hypothetical protein